MPDATDHLLASPENEARLKKSLAEALAEARSVSNGSPELDERPNQPKVSPNSTQDLENRFGFHPATEETKPLHEWTRGIFLEVANAVSKKIPNGREKSLVLTHLEEASFWANAAIARGLAPLEQKPNNG